MDVFDLDRRVVDDYSDFARSFTKIRSADIRRALTSSTRAIGSGLSLSFNLTLTSRSGRRSVISWQAAYCTPTRRNFFSSQALQVERLDRRSISTSTK